MPDTMILGLGNVLHQDDGFGVHAIRALESDTRIPPSITLLDGGTHGLALLAHVAGVRRLIVIDSVDAGEKPGTIVRFEGPALAALPGKSSVHQLGLADLLVALELVGAKPEEIILFGVQPESNDWSTELTAAVESALARIPDLVVDALARWPS